MKYINFVTSTLFKNRNLRFKNVKFSGDWPKRGPGLGQLGTRLSLIVMQQVLNKYFCIECTQFDICASVHCKMF